MPPVVGAFVRGCLEKDPRERVRDIGDVRLAMKGAFDVAGTTPSELTVALHLSVWRRLVSIAAVALTALAVGAVAVWSVTRPAPPRVARFAVSLSDEITVRPAKKWRPEFAAAAVLERGLLADEGIKAESERALARLKQETDATLATVKEQADKAVADAKKMADEIEARARRTAAKISVKDAQDQFTAAVEHDDGQSKVWAVLSVLSLGVLIWPAVPLYAVGPAGWADRRWRVPHAAAHLGPQRGRGRRGPVVSYLSRAHPYGREEPAPGASRQ